MRTAPLLSLFFVLVLSGCSSPDNPVTSVSVRDSAGIRIVENSLDNLSSAPEWALAQTPLLTLGVLEGPDPFQFHQIRGITQLQDLVWVLDRGSCELRAFRMDGSHARTIGRNGEGPGEFILPVHLATREPDTLVVWDQRSQRISYFDLEGNLLRAISIRGDLPNPSFLSALVDGSFLFSSSSVTLPVAGSVEASPLALLRFGSDGFLEDSLGVFPHLQLKRVERPLDFHWVPFSPLTMMSGDRTTVWVGTGEDLEIQERGPSGELIQIVRWQAPDRTVREEHIEAFFSTQIQEAETENERRRIRQTQEQVPVASEFPALADLAVDREGRVWLLEYTRPTDSGPNRWIIFGRNGELVARMRLPRDFRILEFGQDHLFGVERGEFDEEYVVLYEMLKPDPRN